MYLYNNYPFLEFLPLSLRAGGCKKILFNKKNNMLEEKTIKKLKEKWYSFEEVSSISKWLEDVEIWNFIDFEELIKKENYVIKEKAYV